MDTSADRSPKRRNIVGHDIQAKEVYCDRVSLMGMKGIKKQAQWPGEARQREMVLKQWGK